MILLYCANTPGQVAFPYRRVDGRDAPACQYDIIDHLVAIDAGDDIVTAHDAEELCRHHGFRLATPAEQDAYHASQRGASAIHEVAPASAPEVPGITNESPTPEQADEPQAEHTAAPTRGKKGGK